MQSNIVHKVSLKMLSILESNWIFFKKLTFTNKATLFLFHEFIDDHVINNIKLIKNYM